MIRAIEKGDKALFLKLAVEFYSTDAVSHPIPSEHHEKTFNELMRSQNYAECYLFFHDNKVAGYALLAKTFSQELGGVVVWIDEIYTLPEFRGKGIGSEFFRFFDEKYQKVAAGARLEIEPENVRAEKLYRKFGFTPLEYKQLVKKFN